ncbi:hypothetical protein PUN4_1000003 [Paraburkholderia unamae]|nr:hypothetical protein PUN4_1000003 [Paraburkholderia unamae]
MIGAGGTISNSAAVDENNGIYVSTRQMPHKLVWTGSTGGKKRMSLLAFWRNAIAPGFRSPLAGQIPVTCGLPVSYTSDIQSGVQNASS